jgi:hypothetical protein
LRAIPDDTLDSGVQKNFDSVLLQNVQEFDDDIGILIPEQLGTLLEDRHAAAETPEELAEFEADVPAANDQEMLRDYVQLHDRSTVEKRDILETGERGYGGTATGIDKKSVGSERALGAVLQANLDRARPGEAGFSKEEIKSGSLFDARLAAVAEARYDVPLALADTVHVNRDTAGVDTVLGASARQISYAAARNHCFSGSATLVDACAADVYAFNQSGVEAGLRQSLA